ncbi:hypothetical protein A3Q56_05182 [Intoshia linei]|uniref:Uncharacterized protein n=1 Tax=Intoshia linei TaxID=1819745 RepID=A0A177B0W9_9BILA|nr:hypothetical protein A3Q56_05182 [Intoshia linei]
MERRRRNLSKLSSTTICKEMNHINRTIKRKQCIAFLKRAVLKGDIYMIDTYDTPLYYLKEVNEDHQLLLFIKVLAQSTKFWKKIDLSLYSITRHVIVEQNFSVKYIISSDENFSENRKFIMQDDHFIKHAEKPLVCVWKIANMLTLGNIKLMLNKPVNFKYFERVTNLSQGATHLEDENILPFGILPCSLMKYILLNLPIIAITACAMHLACLFGLLTFICPVSATYDLFHRIFAVNKLIKINETTFELARNTGYVSEEIFGYMNAMRIPFMACMGHNLFSHTYWTKSSKKYKYVFELMLTQHDFSNLPRIAQPMGDGEGLYGFDSSMQYRKSAVISSTALGKYTKVYKSTKKTKKMLLKFKKSVQELHIKHNQIMRKKKMKKRPHCQNKFNQEQDNYIRLLCIAERISETVRNIISTTKLKLFAILSKLEIFKPNSKYNLLVRYNVLYDACVNQNNFVIFYLNHNEEIQRDLLLIVDGTIDYISLCDFVGYNVKTFYQLPSEYHIYYYKKFLNLNKHTISEINQQLFLQFVTSYILHNDITFNNRVEFNVMSKQFSHIEKESYFQDLNKFDICFKMEPKKLSNSNMPFKFGKPLSRFYNILYNNTNRGFFKDYETVQSTIKETKYINFVSKGNAVFLIYNWLQNRVKFECDEISDKSLLQYITCTKFNTRGDFIRQKLMFRKYIVDIEKKFGTQDEMSFFTNFFNQNANELTHPDNGSYERILSNLSSKICNNYLDISESTLSQFIMLPNTSNSEYDKKSDMNNMLFNAIKIINFCKTFEERGVNTSDILKEFNESLGYKEEYIHFALNFIIFSKQHFK